MAGRVAVVTGGALGIGRVLATALVARGDIVTVVDLDQRGDAAPLSGCGGTAPA